MKIYLALVMVVLCSSIVFAQGLIPPITSGNLTIYQNNSYYNITNEFIGGNATFNQTLTDSLYSPIGVSSDNASWNQTYADTLYAGIEWDYNQTIPANQYTDETNMSMTSWIDATFLKITDMFSKAQIVNMIFGNWSDLEIRKLNITDQRYNETQIILDNNASWLSNYNATYDSHVQDNESWNESLANDFYVNIDGDTMIGNLTAKWFKGLFNWTTDTNWLTFNGAILTFNETKLNLTIDARATGSGVGNASWNQSYASELYIPIQANLTQSSGNSIAGWINRTFVIVGRN